MSLPGPVHQVSDLFLSLADRALPGLVEGLYLRGSLAFGEWYDGRSDVDFVAVLARRPDQETVERLREVHDEVATTFHRPPFDGFHLTWGDLARPPYACPDVPCTQGGYFHEEARIDVHPVSWHELAHHGVTVRGPEPPELDVWTDEAELRRYTHDNLTTFWRETAESLARFPGEAGKPDFVAWSVLGVSRLHHLLTTGKLTSKTGAGRYAMSRFGRRWHPVVTEALALRVTGGPSGLYEGAEDKRGADTVAFTEMVVRDGALIT